MSGNENHIYIAIDLKSFYASVECRERDLDPLTTNLVVADAERTEKTICLAVSPSLKVYGIPGRARLFEVVQRVKEVNQERSQKLPKLLFFGRTEGTPGAFRHLCDSKATNGTLYEIQYTNLRHLSEIYCAGRYACVLHR